MTNPVQRGLYKLYVNAVVGYIKCFGRSDVSLIQLEDNFDKLMEKAEGLPL